MRTIRERIYYSDFDASEKLQFPHAPKAYLEMACCEWEETSVEEKLLDLGYLVMHGFDLKSYVKKYVVEHPQNKSYILFAFVQLISYLRVQDELGDKGIYTLYYPPKEKDKISIPEAVELFCKEIVLRYEQRITYSSDGYKPLLEQQLKSMPKWDYELLEKLKLSEEEYYNIFKLPTDEYLSRIQQLI